MTTVSKYRVYCNTESTYQTIWGETTPTSCPINTNHTIDPTKTAIADTVEENVVKIKEENIPTGGNFKCDTVVIDAPASTVTYTDVSWPFPVCVYSVTFVTKDIHEGGSVCVQISPNTTIGALVAPVALSAKAFYVSSTVLQYLVVGYSVRITDGINVDDLGYCLTVDKTTNKITTSKGSTHTYSPYTPTYVQMTAYLIETYEIGPAWEYTIGQSKIGGVYLPANALVRATYKNIAPINNKLIIQVEYTY